MFATYTTAHGNAGSLIHWERPRIKPASSWILVRFISAQPWWEHPHCHRDLNKQKTSQFVLLVHSFWNHTHCINISALTKDLKHSDNSLPGNFISKNEHLMPKIVPCILTLFTLLSHFVSIPVAPLQHLSSCHHHLFLCCPTLSSHGLHARIYVESLVRHLGGKVGLFTLPGMPVQLQSVDTSCMTSQQYLCQIIIRALCWLSSAWQYPPVAKPHNGMLGDFFTVWRLSAWAPVRLSWFRITASIDTMSKFFLCA